MAKLVAIGAAEARSVRTVGEAVALFADDLAARTTEELRVAALDQEWRLIALWAASDGEPGTVTVPLRRIFAAALAQDARSIIVAHNHPLGDPAPSAADRALTRRLADAARTLDIWMADHIIVAAGGHYSFREAGLL